jgi:general secretion pathway protein G
MVAATNAQGQIGPPGPDFPYGPYIVGTIPPNPFTLSRNITLYTGTGTPSASGASDAGWIYNPTTGSIWCDDPTFIAY